MRLSLSDVLAAISTRADAFHELSSAEKLKNRILARLFTKRTRHWFANKRIALIRVRRVII